MATGGRFSQTEEEAEAARGVEARPCISLFFPAYLDESTIEDVTRKSIETLSQIAERFEIVIVDDGSPDDTGAVADAMAQRHPEVRVIHHARNLGYGRAIQSGLREANQFEWVCAIDGDDQYDVRELLHIVRLLPFYDVILSFRYRKIYGPWRVFISAVYNVLVRLLFRTRFRDVSSGLRLVRRSVVDDMVVTSKSPFVGAEIAIRAELKGYRIGQVGINTYPRKEGASSIVTPKNIMATIREMLRFRREIFQNKER